MLEKLNYLNLDKSAKNYKTDQKWSEQWSNVWNSLKPPNGSIPYQLWFFLQPNLTLYFLSGFVDSVSLLGYSLQKAGLPSGEKEAVNTGNSRTNPSSSGPSRLSSSPSRKISELFSRSLQEAKYWQLKEKTLLLSSLPHPLLFLPSGHSQTLLLFWKSQKSIFVYNSVRCNSTDLMLILSRFFDQSWGP